MPAQKQQPLQNLSLFPIGPQNSSEPNSNRNYFPPSSWGRTGNLQPLGGSICWWLADEALTKLAWNNTYPTVCCRRTLGCHMSYECIKKSYCLLCTKKRPLVRWWVGEWVTNFPGQILMPLKFIQKLFKYFITPMLFFSQKETKLHHLKKKKFFPRPDLGKFFLCITICSEIFGYILSFKNC